MRKALQVLLDQNIPYAIKPWLETLRTSWRVFHTSQVGLGECTDRYIFEWAQKRKMIIMTFDEDFADQRSFPVGQHHGIIRLRVWPTTIEETQNALNRLLSEVSDEELMGSLIIIDRLHIRIRKP